MAKTPFEQAAARHDARQRRPTQAEKLETHFFDPGPPGWRPGGTLTTRETGWLKPERLLAIPGRKNEHELFLASPTGRMTTDEWAKLVSSIRRGGVKHAVSVAVDPDGSTWIDEGNHRVRAAFIARRLVPVAVAYFGNSQSRGLLFPELERPFFVELGARPNPDRYEPGPYIHPYWQMVRSIKAAAKAVRDFIELHQLGSGFVGGRVRQGVTIVAHVSYNGRIWQVDDLGKLLEPHVELKL